MAHAAAASGGASARLVGLNVGGRTFLTTLSTLASRGPNFLSTMVESDIAGKMPSTKDAAGNYFVDRNGRCFDAVLEYLRTGHLEVPQDVTLESVLRELDFYSNSYAKSPEVRAPYSLLKFATHNAYDAPCCPHLRLEVLDVIFRDDTYCNIHIAIPPTEQGVAALQSVHGTNLTGLAANLRDHWPWVFSGLSEASAADSGVRRCLYRKKNQADTP